MSGGPPDPCTPGRHVLCRAALAEIKAIVRRHHGAQANFVLVVDDEDPLEAMTVYTEACCLQHKADLYAEAVSSVEQLAADLESKARADTMPPKDETH